MKQKKKFKIKIKATKISNKKITTYKKNLKK